MPPTKARRRSVWNATVSFACCVSERMGGELAYGDQGTDLMNDEAHSHKPSKPLFDPTINYGHVLTALSIVIAGTGAYYGMSVELHNVDQRVVKIEATLQQLANVVVLTARQDERLIAIERRLDRLEQASPRR